MTISALKRTNSATQPQRGRRTAIIAYDNLYLFEYSIAIDLFAFPKPSLGVDWYEVEIFCVDGPQTRAIGGVTINGRYDVSGLAQMDTIIIPGWSRFDSLPDQELLEQIKGAYTRGATILSICSGAYLLAYSGILDNKSATTHWLYMDDFKQRFPKINAREDVLYVEEDQIITSAGSAAGIDASLHLIRRDYGSKIANIVARRMVMPPHRDGGQAQFVEAPIPKLFGTSIGKIMDWARQNLEKQILIKDFAKVAGMSERTFLRRFIASNGIGPKEWLTNERLNHGRGLLEETLLPIDQISFQCGFVSPETFRAAFKRRFGVAPGNYRAKFGEK